MRRTDPNVVIVEQAKRLAQDNYNISRGKFVKVAAREYGKVGEAFYFGTAMREFDLIQQEMLDYEKWRTSRDI